jgi:hypothetical protein
MYGNVKPAQLAGVFDGLQFDPHVPGISRARLPSESAQVVCREAIGGGDAGQGNPRAVPVIDRLFELIAKKSQLRLEQLCLSVVHRTLLGCSSTEIRPGQKTEQRFRLATAAPQ